MSSAAETTATETTATETTTAETTTPAGRRTRAATVIAAAVVALAVAMVVVLDLHVASTVPGRLGRTISEHGLGPNWFFFTAALLLLAAGSAGILVALTRRRLLRWFSGASAALVCWSVGIAVIALVPKQDHSLPDTIGGEIHRVASAVAFLSLPVAALLLARAWRGHPEWAGHARRTWVFGVLAAASLIPVFYAIAVAAATGSRWWHVINLGYSERLIAVCEIVALATIGAWALAATRTSPERADDS